MCDCAPPARATHAPRMSCARNARIAPTTHATHAARHRVGDEYTSRSRNSSPCPPSVTEPLAVDCVHKYMCLPDTAQCDACSRPRFKRVSPAARRVGRLLGFFLFAHLACALVRPLSYAFSGALTDLYVVTYGYYIARRFFRVEGAAPVNGICLSCESQQNVTCFLMLVAIDFGLSVWTLLELLLNKPVIPTPVGLPQFDYRTLQMWQWYTGIATAIAVLVLLAAEIFAGWYLLAHLEAEEADLRYDKMIARDLGLEEGHGLGLRV